MGIDKKHRRKQRKEGGKEGRQAGNNGWYVRYRIWV
jgi:hypothetical protein